MAWLFARLGIASLRFSRPVIIAIVLAGLIAVGGIGAWRAAAKVTGYLEARDKVVSELATAAERNHWKAEIAAHEARVAALRLDMAKAAIAADTRLKEAEASHARALDDLRSQNAALPLATAPSLSRDRVRLINRARAAGRPH